MGADVRLMNICTMFNSSAFNGLLCYTPPTLATLNRCASCYGDSVNLELTSKKLTLTTK